MQELRSNVLLYTESFQTEQLQVPLHIGWKGGLRKQKQSQIYIIHPLSNFFCPEVSAYFRLKRHKNGKGTELFEPPNSS